MQFPPVFHFSKAKSAGPEHQRISLMHGSAFIVPVLSVSFSIGIFLTLGIIERSDILADGQILPGFTSRRPGIL